ncbi:hypothetical protein [Nostocoides sp. Soil756]|jgi:hypothetical protein|uniref:hypothetical protein n=1 Tax=Nostocoides sp. Soil756 TaxID=1736399 RepID=UPI0006F99C37|nr:hypothetical protein [Tetrasphaera sp. Soil756]KRE60687.1 hypothetical protein ASG78_14305 [Tetrasphaera sp. Soil756]
MTSKIVLVPDTPPDEPFLVCYDYGTGGLWGVLMAPSAGAIQARYPELAIADEAPPWMSRERYQSLHEEPLWLDDEPPQGLLHALVSDRRRG